MQCEFKYGFPDHVSPFPPHHFLSSLKCVLSKDIYVSKMKVNSWEKQMRAAVIKGIVHPKITFLSLFTRSLTCCPKLVFISFLCWTQNNIFWRMWVIKQQLVHTDFDSREKIYYGSRYGPATVWLPMFGFTFNRRNLFKFKTTWEWVNDVSL